MLEVAEQKVPSIVRFTSSGFRQALEIWISGVINRFTEADRRNNMII